MERFRRSLERFRRALEKFEEIIASEALPEIFSEEFLIEITTKRFEYTFEAMWKNAKDFLSEMGVDCFSPRSCFQALIKEGVVPEDYEGVLGEMIKIRSELVHVYDYERAKDLYEKLRSGEVLEAFRKVYEGLSLRKVE